MDNAELAELARTEGLRPGEIEWLGPLGDMTAFYAELDLFLLTSRAEGFGMVLAEAMGHGVPCVSTDVGAAQEIVGDIGRVVPVGDAEALAQATLTALICTAAERRIRSEAAIGRAVTQFGPRAIRAQYKALLDDRMAGRAYQ